ncbi:hypothetical protein Agabi119p4_6118 [Agaricus bisporus var. burnettii]|uniref:Uncharacterized protein n=1 Tax=Agaricus bisporus var. burnettii TaxID=192524 RepID=A0A8H7F1B6_AGABI|nr:hypothetical protein Agabi119p4_6118 [Agaricus bisporus var. burnettii]
MLINIDTNQPLSLTIQTIKPLLKHTELKGSWLIPRQGNHIFTYQYIFFSSCCWSRSKLWSSTRLLV